MAMGAVAALAPPVLSASECMLELLFLRLFVGHRIVRVFAAGTHDTLVPLGLLRDRLGVVICSRATPHAATRFRLL